MSYDTAALPHAPAPSTEELQRLVKQIATRLGRSLERSGLITRDIENAYATPPSLVLEFRCCIDRLKSQPQAAGRRRETKPI